MAVCPIANSVGCNKCTVVKVCLLRSVLGNYGDETDQEPETTKAETDNPDSS